MRQLRDEDEAEIYGVVSAARA
ncbi:hypothetical protein BVI1335_2430001 [Burkholderia vietnamiensis]|nr:hypothetical protein BVI1335_2430001 [Burkholderia vietnamiensis]